jgi:hypothetical protein
MDCAGGGLAVVVRAGLSHWTSQSRSRTPFPAETKTAYKQSPWGGSDEARSSARDSREQAGDLGLGLGEAGLPAAWVVRPPEPPSLWAARPHTKRQNSATSEKETAGPGHWKSGTPMGRVQKSA